MQGLFVIERSATLSHLVVRTLAAANTQPERVIASFSEAELLLDQLLESSKPPKLIILGAPQRSGPEFQGMLDYFLSGRGANLPVALMAHERTAQINIWLEARRHSVLVLWTNFARLPVALQQLKPESEPGRILAQLVRSGPLRVLFVDDSQSVRFAYKQLLSDQGFDVETASTLTEGHARALSGGFDLIIVDYYLPDGNGDELIAKLKVHPLTSQIPIAVITGTYKDQIIKKCLDAGAVECMFKNEVLELSMARIRALARSVENQKSIDAERQRLGGILESVGDGVYGVDDNGSITVLNPAAIQLLGYLAADELLGRKAHATFHFADESGEPQQEAQSEIAKSYAGGQPLRGFETVFWCKNGNALPVECSVVPLAINGRRQGSVVVFRDISERKSADRLRWELNHDALTGVSNRRHFMQGLLAEIERRRAQGGYAAMLYLDVDRYGLIEEQLGDAHAQRVLTELSQRFAKRLRENDVLARLEEDHFALALSGVQLENLFTIADGFRELAHEIEVEINQRKQRVALSVGVAVISKDTPSAEYVIEHARLAAQQAKRRGGDQTQIYVSELDGRVARELDAGWMSRLKDALEENRFMLLAQPVVALAGIPNEHALHSIQGWRLNHVRPQHIFEITSRLVNRDGQWVMPKVFVPLAERVGLMPRIDLWIIDCALQMLAKAPRESTVFSINLSNLTLQDPESMQAITDTIQRHGVDGAQIIFEVTETHEMGSLHSARKFIQGLRKLGCRFALDDFGTGFSSISHLKHLPVDMVKIEGSFVSELAENEVDQTMVMSITQMAHAMNLKVIAEQVDSDRAFAWLKECGVDFLQGHYFGEPRRLNEIDFTLLTSALAAAA